MSPSKNIINKNCPECGGAASSPSIYWLSEHDGAQELHCNNDFHDPKMRLLQEIKQGF